MSFNLFWLDFWLQDRLFGFGFFTFEGEELHRSLFSIYWNNGELMIDLLWFRILTYFVFGGYKEK